MRLRQFSRLLLATAVILLFDAIGLLSTGRVSPAASSAVDREGTFAASSIEGTPLDPPNVCQSKKLKVAGRHMMALLRCRASGSGHDPSLNACISTIETRLSESLSRIERESRDCTTRGELSALVAEADSSVELIRTHLAVQPGLSSCDGARLVAVGRAVALELRAHARQRRRPRLARFSQGMARLSSRLANDLAAAESLGGCGAAVDPLDAQAAATSAAARITTLLANCTPVNSALLRRHATGLLRDRLEQAADLGFSEIQRAQLCPGPDRLNRGDELLYAGATLANPSASGQMFLSYSMPEQADFLLRVGDGGTVEVLGPSGGVRLDPMGGLAALDELGRAASSAVSPADSRAGAPRECRKTSVELASCVLPFCQQNSEACSPVIRRCFATQAAMAGISLVEFVSILFGNPPNFAIMLGEALANELLLGPYCRSALRDLLVVSDCANPEGMECTKREVTPCQDGSGVCNYLGQCIPDPAGDKPVGTPCNPLSVDGTTRLPAGVCQHRSGSPLFAEELAVNYRCALRGERRYPTCESELEICSDSQTCVPHDPGSSPSEVSCDPPLEEPFKILETDYQSNLSFGGGMTSLSIGFEGSPTFPVRVVSQVRFCSSGSCSASSRSISSPANPIVLDRGFGCIGSSDQDRTGFWSVSLRDSRGIETPPVILTLTCRADF